MTTRKNIILTGFILVTAICVNAQSSPNWMVSKGVQGVANKKTFKEEKANNSHIEAKTVAFPAIVLSKGIGQSKGQPAVGNIVSKGYPTWAISKGVARQSQEKIQTQTDSEQLPNKPLSTDGEPISKR